MKTTTKCGWEEVSFLRPARQVLGRDVCDDVPVSGEAGQAGPGGGGAVGRVVMVSLSCVFVQVTLHKLQSNVN